MISDLLSLWFGACTRLELRLRINHCQLRLPGRELALPPDAKRDSEHEVQQVQLGAGQDSSSGIQRVIYDSPWPQRQQMDGLKTSKTNYVHRSVAG